jgi:hypothetical protein
MASKGYPLTNPNSPPANSSAKCSDEEAFGTHSGDCWVKLSPFEKKLVYLGLLGGWSFQYHAVTKELDE